MTGADLGVVARLEAELFGAEAWSPRTLIPALMSVYTERCATTAPVEPGAGPVAWFSHKT